MTVRSASRRAGGGSERPLTLITPQPPPLYPIIPGLLHPPPLHPAALWIVINLNDQLKTLWETPAVEQNISGQWVAAVKKKKIEACVSRIVDVIIRSQCFCASFGTDRKPRERRVLLSLPCSAPLWARLCHATLSRRVPLCCAAQSALCH